MPINLSIKNAPDEIVQRLRERATRHHRSLQGELMAILEESVRTTISLTPEAVLNEVQRLNLQTPSEAVEDIRADRGPSRSLTPPPSLRCCLVSPKPLPSPPGWVMPNSRPHPCSPSRWSVSA